MQSSLPRVWPTIRVHASYLFNCVLFCIAVQFLPVGPTCLPTGLKVFGWRYTFYPILLNYRLPTVPSTVSGI